MARTGMKNRQSIVMSSVAAPLIPIQIVNADIPASYVANGYFLVRVAFNQKVTGLSQNNAHEVFLFEGAKMSQATPYKWIGDGEPDFDSAVDLDDWQQLAAPPNLPAGERTEDNLFSDDGAWHGEEFRYLLLRFWVPAGTQGIFSMTLRSDGVLRGEMLKGRGYVGF